MGYLVESPEYTVTCGGTSLGTSFTRQSGSVLYYSHLVYTLIFSVFPGFNYKKTIIETET